MLLASTFSADLIVGLCGATIGSLLSYMFFKGAEKKKLVIEFHKEWNSAELSKIRRLADICIEKLPTTNYKDLRYKHEEGSVHVYIIMRFFQRLWRCIKSNNLNKDLTAELFCDFFLYWYFISYQNNLILLEKEFVAAADIKSMHKWIKEIMSDTEYKSLKAKYEDQYNERIKVFNGQSSTLPTDNLAAENTVIISDSFDNISSLTITHRPQKDFLSFYEQIRVLQLKEKGVENKEILKTFNEEKIIVDTDTVRLNVLEKHLKVLDGDTKDYYRKLKNIIFEHAKRDMKVV